MLFFVLFLCCSAFTSRLPLDTHDQCPGTRCYKPAQAHCVFPHCGVVDRIHVALQVALWIPLVKSGRRVEGGGVCGACFIHTNTQSTYKLTNLVLRSVTHTPQDGSKPTFFFFFFWIAVSPISCSVDICVFLFSRISWISEEALQNSNGFSSNLFETYKCDLPLQALNFSWIDHLGENCNPLNDWPQLFQ